MSVRKRNWTTKGVQKETWIVDYFDTTGTRRLKTFAKKKDADAFELKAKTEVRDGTHVADRATCTIREACMLWLGSLHSLERATCENYKRDIRLHIEPFIGSLKLNALTNARLRSYEDELREAGRSLSMVKRVMTTLGIMLGDALERGLVARNAVRERGRRKDTEKRHKGRLKVGTDIPTIEEVKALINVLSGRWKPLILTAVFSGLRASELRGLRWSDVDFDKREIHVRQRADRFNDIGSPKSASSERTVPAPAVVINALREWKLQCPKRNTGKFDDAGKPIKVLNLCFPNGAGKVEGLRNILRRGLHPAWVKAGIAIDTGKLDEQGKPVMGPKYTGLHCLRHWYASWAINRREDGGLGLPAKIVQERMGHSTIAMTMDVYGHLFPRDDDSSELTSAAERLLSTAT